MPYGYLIGYMLLVYPAPMFQWVLINKVIEWLGYTDDAIRAKIKKGVWLRDVHYRKAPDGRLFFNLVAIKEWIEKKD